jgi:hypothetical protein
MYFLASLKQQTKQTNKLHGLNTRANYTDRATAACRRSECQLFMSFKHKKYLNIKYWATLLTDLLVTHLIHKARRIYWFIVPIASAFRTVSIWQMGMKINYTLSTAVAVTIIPESFEFNGPSKLQCLYNRYPYTQRPRENIEFSISNCN